MTKLDPLHMEILRGLKGVSFLAPGRDFKTLLIAMANGGNPALLDQPRIVAGLRVLREKKLVKKKLTYGPDYRRVGGDRYKIKRTWWKLTNEGLQIVINDESFHGRSGGGASPVSARDDSHADPEKSELPDHDATDADQRGHADDVRRSGAEPEGDDGPDDTGDYHTFYRRRPGNAGA